MHNNYYFLRQLSTALQQQLSGSTLVSCFSQAKDELVIEFNDGTNSFFIRAILQSDFSCLTFPAKFSRARKNSVDLFNSLLMQQVTAIRQFTNERSFAIMFGQTALLFKMHGARANVVLIEDNTVTSMFRSHLLPDLGIDLNQLDRHIDWSKEIFLSHRNELNKIYFTFGTPVWAYLDQRGFKQADADQQWKLLTDLRGQLETPSYLIVELESRIALSLLEHGRVRERFDDPILAVTAFAQVYASENAFHREKHALVRHWTNRVAATTSYIDKTDTRLIELDQEQYKLMGDLLMANLHAIAPGRDKVSLMDFSGNGEVQIRLDPRMTPQKNAERYYRKSKNQQLEITRLNELRAVKAKELSEANDRLNEAQQLATLDDVRRAAAPVAVEQEREAISLPYREHEFQGYRIWVGKDAKSNDELTLKYANKDDLWLHARDVSGSHVIIKHEGKTIPKPVVERAAQLAAFHSKRKTESLCPVIVTPKKFVRKRKGDPAGAVVVEREEVVLVEPKG